MKYATIHGTLLQFIETFGRYGHSQRKFSTKSKLTLHAPDLHTYGNRPDRVELLFRFGKNPLLPWLTIVSPHTTNENFSFSCKNWRVHTKRPTIVCFPLYKIEMETFYWQKGQHGEKNGLQYLYNANFLYLSNNLFHHQSIQENWNISYYCLRNNSVNISL